MAWGLYSFGADHTRLAYMDFIAPDMLSPSSGSPVNGEVKPIRATTSSNSGVVRKNFPTVLQRVRGEGERSNAREADDVRPVNKSDDGSHSKEARGQDASPARTKQAEAALSHAEDEGRLSNDESDTAEVSKTDSELSRQENNAGSDIQGQEPAPILAPVSLQTTPEAIGQTDARSEESEHEETEDNSGGIVHSTGSDAEASGDSSKSSLISLATMNSPAAVSDSAEDPSTPNKVSTWSHNLPEQELNATAIQSKNDSQVAQVVKQSTYVVVDDSGSETANLAENPPAPVEAQPSSALPNQDSAARRAFHAYLGAVSPNGKSETLRSDAVTLEEVSQDHSASTQINWYGRSLENSEDIGARARWAFPQGYQPSVDAGEHFNELWADQNGPQPDHPAAKLPQAVVADLQAANGQPAGPVAAGSQSQPGFSSTPPATASFASQSQPAVSTHETAEQSVRLMARSVVLNVAQPDLGRVNIRVAMANDVVHTYLSADRPEVGQFLLNGQDRLQAAFQANGLDMGQFRVDIDRQGAGRSFHHGPSQEQGHNWDQGSQGMKWGESTDRQDEQRASLHGLLNVMA